MGFLPDFVCYDRISLLFIDYQPHLMTALPDKPQDITFLLQITWNDNTAPAEGECHD
jgi:hypothetical protein